MSQPIDTTSPQRKPRITDHLALWLLKLAKLRRRSLSEPTGDDYAKFYEQFFEEKDVEAYDKDRRMNVRRETLNAYLDRYAAKGARLLDIGCGLGDVLAGLTGDLQMSGFDYASSNVRIASRRLKGKATICQASIYEQPYESNSFDAGVCLEVLEHIEDDARAVREIARVLKPGGFLIAAVPYTFYWPQYKAMMGHFRHYTRESFSRLMNENGLQQETLLPNYPNWHQTYTRRYAMIRAQAATVGRLMGRKSLYTFKWPWRGEPALARLAEKLEPLHMKDRELDYSRQETSTFLLARKM